MGDLSQAKLALKTMHLLHAFKVRIRALADSGAPPDPPEGLLLKVLKGQFLFAVQGTTGSKTGFRLLPFGPRTLDQKTIVDAAPVLLEGTKAAFVSSGGYTASQFPQTMSSDTLFVCLRGLGLVLNLLPRCYHNGYADFVRRLDDLRCHLIGRFDITWDFLTKVFAAVAEQMYAFLHQVGEGVLPCWNTWGAVLEERYTLLQTNTGQLQALRALSVDTAREDLPSTLPRGNPFTLFANPLTAPSSDVASISALQRTTESLLQEVARLKSLPPRSPGGGGGKEEGGGRKATKAAREKAKKAAAKSAKAAPGTAAPAAGGGANSGAGAAKSTKLSVAKWIANPALKSLCYKYHVLGTCIESVCPFKNKHGSLTPVQKAAANVV